jgi:hypothetical protein
MTSNAQLLDVSDSGKAVQSRIADAGQANEIVTRMLTLNRVRMERATKVQGMVDGNAPESKAKLKREGRGNDANINWREAKGHIQNAWTPYFDLSTEVPVCVQGDLEYAGPTIDQELSAKFFKEFHDMVFRWKGFEKNEQLRDWQMLQHGVGSMVWENEWDWRPTALSYTNVFVDDETDCDLENCEVLMVTTERNASWLYDKISDAEKGEAAGWNVDAVQNAIMKAGTSSRTYNWQWSKWQQALANGDIYVSQKLTKRVQLATLFVKEMDGSISVHIVQYPLAESPAFLYSRKSLYEDWGQCAVTFPYDIGTDATYHSIKGLGNEIYAYCDLSNRIKNTTANLVLTSILPMFQGEKKDIEAFQMVKYGGFGFVPKGVTRIDGNIGNAVQHALQVSQDFAATLAKNTGTYHNDIEQPTVEETAKAVQIRAMDRAKLTKGAHNRFYRSKDWQMKEMWRRATNPKIRKYHPGGREAVEFQERCAEICKQYGVSAEALQKVRNVRAFRSFGMGNPSMRADISEQLFQIYPQLDEVGKNNVIRAKVAALVGYQGVDAIVPSLTTGEIPTEDDSVAALENNALNTGGEVIITPRQDHGIHLKHHIESMMQDAQGVQQGAMDMREAFGRLEAKGAHAHNHLGLLQQNTLRKQEFAQYSEQLRQLASFTDHLHQNIQEQDAANPQQDPQRPSPEEIKVRGNLQLKAQKQQGDLALKAQRQQADLAMKAHQVAVDTHLKDAANAANIRRQ